MQSSFFMQTNTLLPATVATVFATLVPAGTTLRRRGCRVAFNTQATFATVADRRTTEHAAVDTLVRAGHRVQVKHGACIHTAFIAPHDGTVNWTTRPSRRNRNAYSRVEVKLATV